MEQEKIISNRELENIILREKIIPAPESESVNPPLGDVFEYDVPERDPSNPTPKPPKDLKGKGAEKLVARARLETQQRIDVLNRYAEFHALDHLCRNIQEKDQRPEDVFYRKTKDPKKDQRPEDVFYHFSL